MKGTETNIPWIIKCSARAEKHEKFGGGGVKMDQNEEWQRLIDEYRRITVPEHVRDGIQDAIRRGKKRAARRRRAAYISTAVSCAAAVVLILVLLPNLNAHMADRMGRVPVVGGFFRAVTVRDHSGRVTENASDENGALMALGAESDEGTYAEDDAAYDGAVQARLARGVDAEPAAQDEYTQLLMERFEEENAQGGGHLEMAGYEVVTNSDEWFTLIIYANESTDEGSLTLRKYYNVDKKQDAVMTLGELYNGRDYIAIISDEILCQMRARRAESSEEDTTVSETGAQESAIIFTQINEDQNYYFNEDGNLVIVLDTDQVDSDAAANTEFVINAELLD